MTRVLLVSCTLFCSCNFETKNRTISETQIYGDSKLIFSDIDDTTRHIKHFIKEVLFEEGNIINGKRNGIWVEFDLKGKRIWQGNYSNDNRVYNYDSLYNNCSLNIIQGNFSLDSMTLIKLHCNLINRKDFVVTLKNGGIKLENKLGYKIYSVTPDSNGELVISVVLLKDNGFDIIREYKFLSSPINRQK